MTVILIVAGVLVLLLLTAGFALASYATGGLRQTLDEARAWQEDHYDLSWYDAAEERDYTVTSYDGYLLHAQLLCSPVPSKRFVIISHGFTDNRFGALKYAKMYLDNAWNVVVYDLRGHGVNEPTYCTYTVRERRDLSAMIRDTRERYEGLTHLGIHGESMGAATSVAVLGEKPAVDFVVADCGFAEITEVMKVGLREMHLPGWMVYIASFCFRLRRGYSFAAMRPVDELKENTVPILFMHGADDDFVVPRNSEEMHSATKGYSELYLFPGATHAMSVLTDPAGYRRRLEAFLNKVCPEE